MNNKSGSRTKSFWLGTIVITLFFALIGCILGLWNPETFLIRWYRPVLFALVAAIFGLFFSFLYTIIHEKFPEVDNSLQARMEKITSIARDLGFWKIIYKDGHPDARRILIEDFIEQSINHILEGHECISQQEYVRLLYASSKVATIRIFATSLLSPETWLTGTYHNDYLQYLDLQKKLKRERPELELTRIFINNIKDFKGNLYGDKIVKLHKKAKIKIGYFNLEDLLKAREERFCRDFVFFENQNGIWILDAGTLGASSSLQEEKGSKVRLIDGSLVTSLYSDIIIYLTGPGVKWL